MGRLPRGFPRRIRSVIARSLVRVYPRAWRQRYEGELITLLDVAEPEWSDLGDLARGVASEWMDPSQRVRAGSRSIWRQPRRWILVTGLAYVAMCLACAALILVEWLYYEVRAGVMGPATVTVHDFAALGNQLAYSFSTTSLVVAAVLLGYSLLWSAPMAWLLVRTRADRIAPTASRFVWMVAFQGFTAWIAVHPFAWRDTGVVSLAAGGWVLARAMFASHKPPVPVAS